MYTPPELEKQRAEERPHSVAHAAYWLLSLYSKLQVPICPCRQFRAHGQHAAHLSGSQCHLLPPPPGWLCSPLYYSHYCSFTLPSSNPFLWQFKIMFFSYCKTKLDPVGAAPTCPPAFTTELPQTANASPFFSPPSQLISIWHLPYHFCPDRFKGNQSVPKC